MNLTVSTRYRAAHDSGKRSLRGIKYIVLHATEGASAAGAAMWFANPKSDGSAHYVVDGMNTAYRCVPDDVTPWAAPPCNGNGLHVEQAGFSHWTRLEWLARAQTIGHAAEVVAEWCRRYDIPAQTMSDADLRSGLHRGILTHAQVSRVFHQSDHTDPGANYPMDVLLRSVRQHLSPTPARGLLGRRLRRLIPRGGRKENAL